MPDGPHTPEEQWFHEQEARQRRQLREQMERHAAAEQRQREIAGALGSADEALVHRIQALGLDGESARAIHLLPLVQVAWADGTVSVSERRAILEAARANGIEPGTPAATFLASLLESRPSDTLLAEILALLREILSAQGLRPGSLLEACEGVAQASGGLLGLGDKVSEEEREAIRKVARALGPGIDGKVRDKLG